MRVRAWVLVVATVVRQPQRKAKKVVPWLSSQHQGRRYQAMPRTQVILTKVCLRDSLAFSLFSAVAMTHCVAAGGAVARTEYTDGLELVATQMAALAERTAAGFAKQRQTVFGLATSCDELVAALQAELALPSPKKNRRPSKSEGGEEDFKALLVEELQRQHHNHREELQECMSTFQALPDPALRRRKERARRSRAHAARREGGSVRQGHRGRDAGAHGVHEHWRCQHARACPQVTEAPADARWQEGQ